MIVSSGKSALTGVGGSCHPGLRRLHAKVSKGKPRRPRQASPPDTLLRAVYGLPLDLDQLGLYQQCTGRQASPDHPFGEFTVIAGARAGKDRRIAAPIVGYEALFGGHDPHLAPGRAGRVIPLVAQDIRANPVALGRTPPCS